MPLNEKEKFLIEYFEPTMHYQICMEYSFSISLKMEKYMYIWNKANEFDWWDDFVYNCLPVDHSVVGNYDMLVDLLYNYLKDKPNETV